MMLPELPEPKDRNEALAHAKAYVTHIKESDLMRQVREKRISIEENGAPSWFIKIIDCEIDSCLFMIRSLEEWDSPADPYFFSSKINVRLFTPIGMLNGFLHSECSAQQN